MRVVFEEQQYHLSLPSDFKVTEAEHRKWIQKFLDDEGKIMIVAEVGGELVAILAASSPSSAP